MNQAQSDKFIKMTTWPVPKLIVSLAIPTMVSMLVTTLYNLADTYFVGQLEDVRATAAVTVSFSVMTLIQAVGFFFGHGSGNYISRALGRKDTETSKKIGATAFFSAISAGFLILLVGTLFLENFALLFGSENDAVSLKYAKEYMQIILIGAPFMCGSLVLNNQLRYQGNAVFSMVGLFCGAVINVFLDAILVPKYGVKGAAAATMVCQIISLITLFVLSRFFSDNVKYTIKDFTFKTFYFKEITRGGLPSLCRQGVTSIKNVFLMQCCLYAESEIYSAAALQSAFGIVGKVLFLAISLLIGFGQGFQPFCGFNFGAKKYDRVIKGFRFSVVSSFLVLILLSVIFYFACPYIMPYIQAGEGADVEVTVALSVEVARIQLVTLSLSSFIVISNMMVQTTGDMVGASIVAMGRQGIVLIPLMLLFTKLWGVKGLTYAQPIADVLTLFLAIPFAMKLIHFMKKESQKNS